MDERAGACLERSEARGVAVLASEEDELGLRPDLTDADSGIGSSSVGQPEVEDDDVGAELGSEVIDSPTDRPCRPPSCLPGHQSAPRPSATTWWSSTIRTRITVELTRGRDPEFDLGALAGLA